jgi:hypothetical protein
VPTTQNPKSKGEEDHITDNEAQIQTNMPKRLAITISGAVSLGSYEAGVLCVWAQFSQSLPRKGYVAS